ncbi:peptide ABC transporter substrate-binding protein [Effusibacillus pohliae]|uniref:peptide ABC transporter substrate-binding protein n=1 Tax=Effusibacillus pohliae TaxID=232270 RepID=UPI0003818A53|nr:peptide ABC transporter substrate-binding protein [Effusibacillus pohliae]
MKAKKWLSAAVVLTMAGSVLAGCSKGGDNAQGGTTGAKQELNIAFSAEPPALDNSKATASAAFTMINAFNEGLYRLDKDGKAQPALAKALPEISPDGKTYKITLRDGITYWDGTPVKASDFEYAWKRTLDPATKSQYAFMVAWIKGGKEYNEGKGKAEDVQVKALDDKTLQFTLEQPKAFFTELLAFPLFFPQQPDFVKKAGDKYGTDADKVLGAGPFKLEKWDHEQQLVFVKNDKYWDAKNVKLEKVTVQIVKDTNTALNLFETGAVDLAQINRDAIPKWKDKPEYTLKKELVTQYMMYNENVPVLKNKKIRQALTMAIDRQAYVDVVLANGSQPSTGFVPNGTLDGNGNDFRKTAGDLEPKFDAAKAKQLLQEGLQELGMSSFPKLKVLADDTETAKKSLEFVIAQWKQNLGIELIAEPVPHKLRLERSTNRQYDIVVSLWGADYNDPMTFLDMWVTKGEFNECDWSNAQYDQLIKAAQTETDRAKRAKLLVDAEKILMDEMPIGPMYFRNLVYLKKTKVDGLILPVYGEEWELKWTSIK